jgi:hypothetical protein
LNDGGDDVPEEQTVLVSNRFSSPPPVTPTSAAPILAAPEPASPESLVPVEVERKEEDVDTPDLLGDLTNEPQAQTEDELVDTSDTGHEAVPQTTIKLVGRNPGVSGTATPQEDQENISEKELEEAAPTVEPTKKAHKKTKSGLSLKKFTGGRKKGSEDLTK